MAVWDLSVTVEDLGSDAPPVNISVTSELHIGGVILKIVEKTRELLYIIHPAQVGEFGAFFKNRIRFFLLF